MPRPTRRGPPRREPDVQLETLTRHELVQVAYFGGLLRDHAFVFSATLEQRLEAATMLRERAGAQRPPDAPPS
jgi:hypothetical protein